jgi:hypothetical protein
MAVLARDSAFYRLLSAASELFYGHRNAGDRFHKMVQWIDRGAIVLMGGFIAYSGLLYSNGRFDQSPPAEQRAEIVSIAKINLLGEIFGEASVAAIRFADRPEHTAAVLLT